MARPTRTRATTGARCELPGCGARAAQGSHPATITVNGHAVIVERLCPEHRRALHGPNRAERSTRPRRSSSPSSIRYRCHECGLTYESYRAAEACTDAHDGGGGRISCDEPT